MATALFSSLDARFPEELEHVLLVDFDTRLIEGVDAEEIGREGRRPEEEIEEIPEIVGIHLLDLEDVRRGMAFGVGLQCRMVGLVVDVGNGLAGEIVEIVRCFQQCFCRDILIIVKFHVRNF